MAVRLQDTNVTTDVVDDFAIYLTADDDLFIYQGVTVAAIGSVTQWTDGGDGVHGDDGNNSVHVYGTVISASGDGIDLGYYDKGSNEVFVSGTGVISAERSGIYVDGGSNTVTNAGSIWGGDGIIASGWGNDITNSGTIAAQRYGIDAYGGSSSVSNSGSITSDLYGVGVWWGSNDLINTGSITAGSLGVFVEGSSNVIINSGDITAGDAGVEIYGWDWDPTDNRVINHGTITGDSYGIIIGSWWEGTANRVVNFGTISSAGIAIAGGGGDETVINRGTIDGNVALSAGTDTYKGDGGMVIGNIEGGDGNDLLVGGGFDDVLLGGNNDDILRGRYGDDLLDGGAGTDIMRGGAGEDIFDFNATADSGVGASRDTIMGFEKGSDLIDLLTIDANTGADGDQAFRFTGTRLFTGIAQVRVFTNGLNTIVEGNVNSDLAADFQIRLAGNVALSATDFDL